MKGVMEIKKKQEVNVEYMKYLEEMAEERAEAWAEGRAEGELQMLINLVSEGLITVDIAAEKAHLSSEEFQAKVELFLREKALKY